MKVLITGGSGQVGSHIAETLLGRGDEVVAIDNFATGRRDNLAPHPIFRLVENSIVHGAVINELMAEFRPDVVVHTAASYKDPDDWETDALVNCTGTAILAKACKTYKVPRLIYFQTALCYGTRPLQSPIQLEHPINPVNSSYAISKTAGEHYVQFSGVDWVTFRLANVIGPRNVLVRSRSFSSGYRAVKSASLLKHDVTSVLLEISLVWSCGQSMARDMGLTISPAAGKFPSLSFIIRWYAP